MPGNGGMNPLVRIPCRQIDYNLTIPLAVGFTTWIMAATLGVALG